MAKILFYQTVWWESLGVMSMAGVLKRHGHQCRVFFGSKKKFVKEIREWEPDLIGFSCTSAQMPEVLQVSGYLKENHISVPVVLGGIHPTIYPEVIDHSAVDYVCLGDGEYTLLELMEWLDGKNGRLQDIQGLYYKQNGKACRNPLRPLTKDLDALGFPDRSIYYDRYRFFRDAPIKTFMLSRGCPYQCSFCTNHILHELYKGNGSVMRYRSAESLTGEILSVKKTYGIQFVFFQDEIFNVHKKRLAAFLDLYKRKIRIPFWCKIRADSVTEDAARDLSEANCSVVEIGVETGDRSFRDAVLHKGLKDEQIIEAVAILKKYKINIRVNNLFGLPGETLEDALCTVEFTKRLKPQFLSASIFQPYPRLRLTSSAVQKKIIPDIDFNNMPAHGNRGSLLKQKDIQSVCNLHRFYYLLVKIPFFAPAVKRLIKLPPNVLFNFIHDVSYGIMNYLQYRRCRVTALRYIWEGLKNYKSV